MNNNEKKEVIDIIARFIVLIIFLFLSPALERIAWNYAIPEIFSLPRITYWQMFALNYLCTLLFSRKTFKE